MSKGETVKPKKNKKKEKEKKKKSSSWNRSLQCPEAQQDVVKLLRWRRCYSVTWMAVWPVTSLHFGFVIGQFEAKRWSLMMNETRKLIYILEEGLSLESRMLLFICLFFFGLWLHLVIFSYTQEWKSVTSRGRLICSWMNVLRPPLACARHLGSRTAKV